MKLEINKEDENIVYIIKKHFEIQLNLKNSLQNAQDIGKALKDIKAEIDHGEFLPFIEKNLPFSMRTAQSYMRLYTERTQLKLLGINQITNAYISLIPKKEIEDKTKKERDKLEIVRPFDGDIEDVFITNAEEDIVINYEYWDILNDLINKMNESYKNLVKLKYENMPKSLSYMIGNVKDEILRLKSWDPDKLEECVYCAGAGCEMCLDGKAGISNMTTN